jgi:hypothetical protein
MTGSLRCDNFTLQPTNGLVNELEKDRCRLKPFASGLGWKQIRLICFQGKCWIKSIPIPSVECSVRQNKSLCEWYNHRIWMVITRQMMYSSHAAIQSMGRVLSCSEGEDHVLHIWVRHWIENIIYTQNVMDDYIGGGVRSNKSRGVAVCPCACFGVASGTW